MTTHQTRSTAAQMPKLLHALCCCLRPNPLNDKNDPRSTNININNNVYDSSRGISKATSSPVVNKTSAHLAGDLRQRLNPSSKTEKTSKNKYVFSFGIGKNTQQQQQKRMATQISIDGNSNIIASTNNNNTSNIAIDGPFIAGNEKQQQNELQHSTSNLSSSQIQQQNNYSSPLASRVQWPPLAPLLSNPIHRDRNKKCLILDLDETLVHSSFKPVKNADFVIPIEIDNVVHQVYVLKRPHTDHFLERVGALFECVLFTASLAKYADPVADLLDRRQVFRFRLFREACVFFEGNYVKDLEKLGRDLRKVVIIDNSPASYAFHPNNSLPIRTWFDDPDDTELLDLLPILEELARVEDIYSLIGNFPSPISSLQQQQQRYQQQQRLQQQYSSPYYHQTSTGDNSSNLSSIITQAALPSSCDNNNNNEEDQQRQQQQQSNKQQKSSLIFIQMGTERKVENEENILKKKEENNQKLDEMNRLRRRRRIGGAENNSANEHQQQQSVGANNNNNNFNLQRNFTSDGSSTTTTTSNNFGSNNNFGGGGGGFNTTITTPNKNINNNNTTTNDGVNYYSSSRPSTSFIGWKKWK